MKLIRWLLVLGGCSNLGVHTVPNQADDAAVGSGSEILLDAGMISITGAHANCPLAEGPLHLYSDVSEFVPLAYGQWVRCSGPKILSTEDQGIEFDADGSYYILGDDGDDGVVKLTGFGKQGTWDAEQVTTRVQWNLHATPNSLNPNYAVFEDGPRKFAITVYPHQINSIYAIVP